MELGKKKKRANGLGSVRKRIDGTWEASWKNMESDTPKRFYVHGKTAEEAEWKMYIARGDVKPGETDDESGSSVYFVQGFTGGPIKIGISANVDARFKVLQLSCPIALRIVHVVSGVDRKYELHLHKRFAPYRLHGEWFEASHELLSFIEALKNKPESKAV